MTRGARVTVAAFFVAACNFFSESFAVDPDLSLVFCSRGSVACIHCTCVVAIDAPAEIIIAAG
jgi:hypothetical protein